MLIYFSWYYVRYLFVLSSNIFSQYYSFDFGKGLLTHLRGGGGGKTTPSYPPKVDFTSNKHDECLCKNPQSKYHASNINWWVINARLCLFVIPCFFLVVSDRCDFLETWLWRGIWNNIIVSVLAVLLALLVSTSDCDYIPSDGSYDRLPKWRRLFYIPVIWQDR